MWSWKRYRNCLSPRLRCCQVLDKSVACSWLSPVIEHQRMVSAKRPYRWTNAWFQSLFTLIWSVSFEFTFRTLKKSYWVNVPSNRFTVIFIISNVGPWTLPLLWTLAKFEVNLLNRLVMYSLHVQHDKKVFRRWKSLGEPGTLTGVVRVSFVLLNPPSEWLPFHSCC